MARPPATKVRTKPAAAQPQAQTQKTITAATSQTGQASKISSDQIVDQGQSTEIAQTLILGSISCVSYLRSLFPEGCFDNQYYGSSDAHWSYANFAAGKPEGESGTSKRSSHRQGVTMSVLRRHRDKAVDTLLDTLEQGAFQALKLGVLRALQLRIFEDADQPSKILETYTFTFDYVQGVESGPIIAGWKMQGPTGTSVTIKTAQIALQTSIRALLTLCRTLSDLPARRYLMMHLFYTENCDPDYEPSGFEKCLDNNIYFPGGDGWEKQTQPCGAMDAGFHKVSLKVSYLQPSQNNGQVSADMGLEIPQGLPYTHAVSAEEDIDVHTVGDRSVHVPTEAATTTEQSMLKTQQSTRPDTQLEVLRTPDSPSKAPSNPPRLARLPQAQPGQTDTDRLAPPTKIFEEPLDYQNVDDMDLDENDTTPRQTTLSTAGDREMMEDTQMLQPRQIVNFDVAGSNTQPTQLREDLRTKLTLQQMLAPSTQDQSLEETQHLESNSDSYGRAFEPQGSTSKVQLSVNKLDELRSRIKPLSRTSRQLSKGSGQSTEITSRFVSEDVVRCECGWNEEEDDMVNCQFCDTWQHMHCYGYLGSKDPRLPDVHACYKCLLQEKEGPLLLQLQKLALLRRGIHVMKQEGYNNDKEFSESLHCDLQTAARVVKHLREEGFLIAAKGYKSKGFSRRGQPKFGVVSTGPVHEKLMKEYFDPLARIAHHFEIPQHGVLDTVQTTQLAPPPRDLEITQDLWKDTTMPTAVDSHPQQIPASDETLDEIQISQPNHSRALHSGTASHVTPIEGTQGPTRQAESRYALRRPRQGSAAGEALHVIDPNIASPHATPTRKRNRSGAKDVPATPGSAKKRLKSSKSRWLIDVRHVSATPSPGK